MSYSPDEWSALCDEIERTGGALLPDKCTGVTISFPVPGTRKKSKILTQHCEQETMLVIVYDPSMNDSERNSMSGRGAGYARVCGLCDAVGSWPRFQHVVESSGGHHEH